ncbi:hypothetical protein Acsp02_37960 [Actinoplanes sp. NBRC 103695]|nr:hypothetical protein Acsp02_37960 [Actinoplanes sp. NBRC 103695]
MAAGGHHRDAAYMKIRLFSRHARMLPVAVAGGFSVTDHAAKHSTLWDILVVGRSVTDALDPAKAARHLVNYIVGGEEH